MVTQQKIQDPRRYLIVNADDFGQSNGINLGIIEAHTSGIVTSASLMVRWSAALEAAQYGREHPDLSLGLHFDLGEWTYLNETWLPLYQVLNLEDERAVVDELARQLKEFYRLTGKEPTHLDSHQHVHRAEPVRSIMVNAARKLGIPLRDNDPRIRYLGSFYGQTGSGVPIDGSISTSALGHLLMSLRPGITELGCHPGKVDNFVSMYRKEREEEVRVLCDPVIRDVIARQDLQLCSFGNLRSILGSPP